jgi:uncharacterized membrane protein YraQ (UPF0718 family)
MIVLLTLIFRRFLRKRRIAEARQQTDRGLAGRMDGHAAMDDMALGGNVSILQKLNSPAGFTATSHFFVMDWVSIWLDIIVGLLIAGALAAWIPTYVWQSVFLMKHPAVSAIWGPLVGPLLAVVSFVCSVGNVPLAAVLRNGGISFGGVISFIFADLIILPIIRIYAKYYGWKMAGFLFASLYTAMVGAGYLINILFGLLHVTPHIRNAKVLDAAISWNYTSVLNILFLLIVGALIWRFVRTGGVKMIKRMNAT